MASLRIQFLFLTGLTVSLVLTGCTTSNNKYAARNGAEDLLHSQDQQMQTAAADADDPMAAHLRARAQVDPSDLSTHHAYTTKPTAEEVNKDTNVRVVRLENQVADLQSDFKKLIPHISKATEDRLAAERQLAANTQGNLQNSPPVEETMPDTPVSANATSSVMRVRVGEHETSTRLVLDMNAPGKFSYDINGTSLTVTLPQSTWQAAKEKMLPGSLMIAGYKVTQAPAGGVALNVELKKPGKLTLTGTLPPNDTYGDRIVFDVAPL